MMNIKYTELRKNRSENTLVMSLWWWKNELLSIGFEEDSPELEEELAKAEPVLRFMADYCFIDADKL